MLLKSAISRCVRQSPGCTAQMVTSQRQHQNGQENIYAQTFRKRFDSDGQGQKTTARRNVKVRKATLGDYDSVLKLRERCVHFDSLADRYCMHISKQTNAGYVATAEGSDDGFLLTHTVDNGSHLVLDACYTVDGDETTKDALYAYVFSSKEPQVKRMSMLMSGDDLLRNLGPHDWSIVASKVKDESSANVANLLESLRKYPVHLKSAKRIVPRDSGQILKSPNIFKNDKILKSGILYRPITQNVQLLMDNRTLLIGSNLSENNMALLTIGSFYHESNGLVYRLSIHGNTNANMDEHLYLHMMSLLNRSHSNIKFETTVDGKQDLEKVQTFLAKYSFTPARVGYGNTVNWYEMNV